MTQITPTKHAFLNPSSAHRWLYCTPSARATEHIEEEPTVYADEGTLAHEFAGLFVKKHYSTMKKSDFEARLTSLRKHELYSKAMEDHAADYLEYIKQIIGDRQDFLIKVETELDLTSYIPESFGTSDCFIAIGSDLHVIDYKYGRGVKVEAEGNDQLRIYALGALKWMKIYFSFENVHMHIFQPRLGGASSCQMLAEDLVQWGREFVQNLARLAFVGEGDFAPGPKVCRWCPIRGLCEARRLYVIQKLKEIENQKVFPVPEITPEDKARILTVAPEIKDWLRDVENQAQRDLESGKSIPGFKLVEGRSNRTITDEKKAGTLLRKAGFKTSDFTEKKLLGITKLEGLVGTKELPEILGDLITKPKGRATIAPEDDPRENYQRVDPKVIFGNTKEGVKNAETAE